MAAKRIYARLMFAPALPPLPTPQQQRGVNRWVPRSPADSAEHSRTAVHNRVEAPTRRYFRQPLLLCGGCGDSCRLQPMTAQEAFGVRIQAF
jgi:hypothetical protein